MGRFLAHRRRRPPAGFTLVEALISVSITGIAGSVLLLGITSSLQTSDEALKQTIASGMAQQLMDEVVGARYHALGADGREVNLGPSAYERQGPGRQRYDDIDDYHGLRANPPTDRWGVALGSEDLDGEKRHQSFRIPAAFFDNWWQEVDVYYVDASDLTTRLPVGKVSDYRVVEVRIVHDHPQRGSRELASLHQVVAYVPPLQ